MIFANYIVISVVYTSERVLSFPGTVWAILVFISEAVTHRAISLQRLPNFFFLLSEEIRVSKNFTC